MAPARYDMSAHRTAAMSRLRAHPFCVSMLAPILGQQQPGAEPAVDPVRPVERAEIQVTP